MSVRDLHREREKAEHQEADHGGGFHNGVARTGDNVAGCVGAGGVVTRRVGGSAFTLGADVGFDVLVGGAQSFVARRVRTTGRIACRVGGAGGTRDAGVRGDVLVSGADCGGAGGRAGGADGAGGRSTTSGAATQSSRVLLWLGSDRIVQHSQARGPSGLRTIRCRF